MQKKKMPLYAVFHANDLTPWLLKPDEGNYQLVAVAQAPLEDVFRLTNHLDFPWWENTQILWSPVNGTKEMLESLMRVFPEARFAEKPPRSTSVGDRIVCCTTKRAWLIIPVGFQEIQ
jgi:hypothetical protein